MTLTRRALLPTLLTAATLALPLVAGCGNSAPVIKVDDVVELTEDTLTETLLGPQDRSATDPVPRDRPLLRKGEYETVLIAADEKGFASLSKGALREDSVREITERVTRTVNKRVSKHGFKAKRISFPPPGSAALPEERPIIATLVPVTQEAGSPQDKAQGKGRQMILVRLTVTDPKNGTILAARDYYSGTDVPINGRPAGRPGDRDADETERRRR
jgi:hypothetical protein